MGFGFGIIVFAGVAVSLVVGVLIGLSTKVAFVVAKLEETGWKIEPPGRAKNKKESGRKGTKPDYKEIPTLYPMGDYTFPLACALCDHLPERTGEKLTERCDKCLRQVESGWEPNKDKLDKI